MHVQSLQAAKPSLAYAKLTATPTEKAWSQVYNAGNLFACLALTSKDDETSLSQLQSIGKTIFNNLEAEFFTLEEKSLPSITEAIQKSVKELPENVASDFCLSYFKDATLYLFLLGNGKIMIKRNEKIGILLQQKDTTTPTMHTASGYLHNGDTIVLETEQFVNTISDEQIASALQLSLPNDIAETLSVPMHAKQQGGQAAMIIVYHGITQPQQTVMEEENDTIPEHEPSEDEEEASEFATQKFTPPHLPTFKFKLPHITMPHALTSHTNRLNHTRKLFLSISVVIAVLLIVSIFLTKQQQENARTEALFASVYTPAQKNYDEGQALESINKDVSRQDYLKAEQTLKNGQNKFSPTSKEGKQIEQLLAKVQAALGPSEETVTTSLKEATVGNDDMLVLEKANPDGLNFSQNDENVYIVTAKAIESVNKSSSKKQTLIKNENAWKKPAGIAPYQSNLYLLDQQAGVLKYVAGGDGYSKSSYFKTSPKLTNATSIAIDSSVYILFTDGTIQKYTKGEAEDFVVKGLDKPFTSPTKIFTDADTTSIYVLDPGSSRVVKLSKEGSFQAQYAATEIKQAKDFEIKEKDKKAFILANGKIYELYLK